LAGLKVTNHVDRIAALLLGLGVIAAESGLLENSE